MTRETIAFTPESSVLLLVDLQARLMPAIADHEAVVANALRLARAATLLGIPVLGTEQNPAGLGPNVAEIREACTHTLAKQHFDATREAHWPGFLPAGRPDIVVAGCEAHVCVLQTVMGLRRAGAPVRLVRDAIGSRSPASRDAAIARAQGHGAEPVTTEMVIFEWLASAEHPRFREVLRLVK
jgi:nicotinamidase-related amidase